MPRFSVSTCLAAALGAALLCSLVCLDSAGIGAAASQAAQQKSKKQKKQKSKVEDAKNTSTGKPVPPNDPEFARYGIYHQTAPRAAKKLPGVTKLPLTLEPGARIAFVGNTLLERAQYFGFFEAMLHQTFPDHKLVVRNLCWSADETDLQPRPENFADQDQHLTHEKVDVIFAAYGFNESFAGEEGLAKFRKSLNDYLVGVTSKAFNGKTTPQVVLVSPIANEDIDGVAAGSMNNERIRLYVNAMREVAQENGVGFVDVFSVTEKAMSSPGGDLTINGCHLNEDGYSLFSSTLFRGLFETEPPKPNDEIRKNILDRNRQYFRRYRPLNTFYYTGGRNKTYGYLDFLPAMKNFDIMVANRDQRIWDLAAGKQVTEEVDDSNVPQLPLTAQTRGANRWIPAAEEQKAFKVDPRFEVNLFAGEEEFPDIAAPIQMRWDAKGRLWVSCSTTYPHVYPGNEPNDKLVILEDTDGDGKADTSTVFADDLHIPLSFEFGNGGVYVSDEPHLTFLKDTDGDGKADFQRQIFTGFGTEDSHHALHDFAWTPDGDLIFREGIFHHSQVETPYGPVRQANSGWFRYDPKTHRLSGFGTYHSTNPWGVTFDDWGQHMASHPVYAAAFHALDPPFPTQHPRPAGLQAYSGVCGQEFVDFATFPDELRGSFIKVRYKPTNRVEILKWKEGEFGYTEEYVSDLIFSTNLSFIPVDLRYGPRGAMYVCDWYNPVKGHAQYSLRDERRDRHSGRIWRITAKGKPLTNPPRIAGASIEELLEIHKRPEYRYRYWAKRELRERNPDEVEKALARWVASLDPNDARFRHHQIEAVWLYRNIGRVKTKLLKEILACDEHHARAAAVEQLRYWHTEMPDHIALLRRAANDSNGIVRMQAVIAASYVGTQDAFRAALDVFKHPADKHLAYAISSSLGSRSLRPHWENSDEFGIAKLLKKAQRSFELKEPTPTAREAEFDTQKNLKTVTISCMPERMKYTLEQFAVTTGQPVKIVFKNPDATDHNLVIVRPGALAEVGMAANEMARDPKNSNSDFIPESKKDLILHASPMIGPTRQTQVNVLRFVAPTEPGIYPFVCTFPGHWIIMKGDIVVARDLRDVNSMLAAQKPAFVKDWKMSDFAGFPKLKHDETTVMRGMAAFVKARCNQCHVVAGHGISLGPDLTKIAERSKGKKLLEQMLAPSTEINKQFQTWQFLMNDGKVHSGVISKEDASDYHVIKNLLIPTAVTKIAKKEVDERFASKVSPMPEGLLKVLTREEILDVVSFLEAGGYQLPGHLKHKHGDQKKPCDCCATAVFPGGPMLNPAKESPRSGN